MPPKEHDITITKVVLGDMCSDVAVSWGLSVMSSLERYKRVFTQGVGFEAADSERAQGSMQNGRVFQCIPAPWFARNTQPRGNTCFSVLFFHDHVPLTNQASILYDILLLGGH